MVRRRRNNICFIKDQVRWLTGKKEISDYFKLNFQKLYSTTNPALPEKLVNETSLCVTAEENREIMRVPTEEEIKECIWSMHPLKAPGPDGFLGDFFRSYWNIVKN